MYMYSLSLLESVVVESYTQQCTFNRNRSLHGWFWGLPRESPSTTYKVHNMYILAISG